MSTSVSACVGALASTLTVEIHSAASGFRLGYPHRRGRIASIGGRLRRSNAQGREWVSRLERRAETCMPGNCRLALMVEVRWVASGFISRTDAPDPACCTIAGGRSTWKCFGSRVGYLPESTLEHACCAIASLHSAWKRTGSRAGLSAGRAHWYTHAGQSRAALRGDALGRERVYRPDMYAATRIRHNREPALTVEIHRASSVCNSGYPRPIRPCRPATRAPSPLKTTALRVVRDAGYPHACAFADAMTDARSERRDRPAILAGQGSPADRVLTLTVEMHSVASRFGDRISTRGRVGPARTLASEPDMHATSDGTAGRTIASCRAD